MLNYIIRTDTNRDKYAGTTERVFVRLIGMDIPTPQLELQNPNGAFESGKSSDFYFRFLPDIGELMAVEVTISQEHLNSNDGSNDAWLLDNITVQKLFGNQVIAQWKAPCGKWIGDSKKPEDEEELVRVLQAMREEVLV